jgi:predicted dehydrogenase
VQFTYAIEKRLNAFMEKPITVDGPSTRRMFALGEEAARHNLKVGVGLMCRHCDARKELEQRIRDGQMGEINLLRCYRMHGPVGFFESPPKPANISHLMYQVQRFHSFLWASGGCFSDFYIHNIDECCWMKGGFPVSAQASGGRHYRGNSIDQNFDTYSVEYTFADGAKMYMDGRCMNGCNDIYSSYAHGSKGLAIVSKSSDCGFPSTTFKGQNMQRSNMLWTSKAIPDEQDPYENEWNDLMEAIRNDKPYNEVKRGVEASLVTSMGRMAAHTGQEITYEEMLNSEHEYAPGVDKLTFSSPAPLVADKDGKYPIPMPGITRKTEY